MSETLIRVDDLHHSYGKTLAVDGLSLEVGAGEVHGLLGHNGAGKTTTIKSLLGLLKPTSGSLSVLGLDPARDAVEIRKRTGYVPENLRAYDWMSIEQTLRFVSAFHPTWDCDLQREMVRRLELPLERKFGELSRGMLAKVALTSATAFRPEALILDDPTSGLDALVRREFLEQVIELAAEGGRAVLFSSHVLDEVERLADVVSIVVAGRKVFERRVDDIKTGFRRVVMQLETDEPLEAMEGVVSRRREGSKVELVVSDWSDETEARLRALGEPTVEPLGLEDVFVEVVKAAKRGAFSEEAA